MSQFICFSTHFLSLHPLVVLFEHLLAILVSQLSSEVVDGHEEVGCVCFGYQRILHEFHLFCSRILVEVTLID